MTSPGPASQRDVAADLARALADLYAATATRIAADIARRLAQGDDTPQWAQDKLAALATLRVWTLNVLRQLQSDSGDLVAQTLVLAYIRGASDGLDTLARLALTPAQRGALARQRSLLARLRRAARAGMQAHIEQELHAVREALPGIDGLQAMMFALTTTLSGTHMPLLRWTLDTYRTVVTQASAATVLGVATRRRAAQVAWERLIAQGVTGFTDRAGRRWELASYVEMATRTVVHQTLRTGHIDRLIDAGHDLIRISDSPQECELCRPWENEVLTIAGPPGARVERHEHATDDGVFVDVPVAGSLPEAISKGLYHPNCTHSLAAYLPGISRPTHAPTDNAQGYADRVKLRELERKVRRAKLAAASVIDPAAQQAANAKVRRAQAAVRAHIAATGLLRQRHREQIGTAR